MKRLILAITAASLLVGTAAMADPYDHNRNRPYNDGHRTVSHTSYQQHDWRRGERLPAEWRRSHDIDWRAYHLRQPPRGYAWVRAHNDFALIARSNGVILDLDFAR